MCSDLLEKNQKLFIECPSPTLNMQYIQNVTKSFKIHPSAFTSLAWYEYGTQEKQCIINFWNFQVHLATQYNRKCTTGFTVYHTLYILRVHCIFHKVVADAQAIIACKFKCAKCKMVGLFVSQK